MRGRAESTNGHGRGIDATFSLPVLLLGAGDAAVTAAAAATCTYRPGLKLHSNLKASPRPLGIMLEVGTTVWYPLLRLRSTLGHPAPAAPLDQRPSYLTLILGSGVPLSLSHFHAVARSSKVRPSLFSPLSAARASTTPPTGLSGEGAPARARGSRRSPRKGRTLLMSGR